MIEKELTFHYNKNFRFIFDVTTNNNTEVLQMIDDLRSYKQGVWNKNKRKDIIVFTFSDIPSEFKTITDMIIQDNIIPLKLKIKLLEDNDKRIVMKVKSNLINNKLANLVFKLINIKFFVTIEDFDGVSTNVKIRYVIKSFLPESLIAKVDSYIDRKMNDRFIQKIDNYLSQLK